MFGGCECPFCGNVGSLRGRIEGGESGPYFGLGQGVIGYFFSFVFKRLSVPGVEVEMPRRYCLSGSAIESPFLRRGHFRMCLSCCTIWGETCKISTEWAHDVVARYGMRGPRTKAGSRDRSCSPNTCPFCGSAHLSTGKYDDAHFHPEDIDDPFSCTVNGFGVACLECGSIWGNVDRGSMIAIVSRSASTGQRDAFLSELKKGISETIPHVVGWGRLEPSISDLPITIDAPGWGFRSLFTRRVTINDHFVETQRCIGRSTRVPRRRFTHLQICEADLVTVGLEYMGRCYYVTIASSEGRHDVRLYCLKWPEFDVESFFDRLSTLLRIPIVRRKQDGRLDILRLLIPTG